MPQSVARLCALVVCAVALGTILSTSRFIEESERTSVNTRAAVGVMFMF